MVVVLINPNRAQPSVPPVGLDYLSDSLMAAGHDVYLYDFGLQRPSGLKDFIARKSPDVVGISVRNIDDVNIRRKREYITPVTRLARSLRGICGAKIVLGGAGFSFMPREIMEATGADYGVVGDGEGTLPSLLDRLDAPETVPNVLYRTDGGKGVVKETERFFPSLDSMPSSPRSLVDYAGYLKKGSASNVQTKRGCRHRCIYCPEARLSGMRVRVRSPESVVEELAVLHSYGFRDKIFMADSEFNVDPDHARAVARALLESGLRIKWTCYMIPDDVDRDLIDLMKRAGCDLVVWSIDAAGEEMLGRLRKDVTVSDILDASRHCDAAGLSYCHAVLFGGPGESFETVDETWANLSRTKASFLAVAAGIRIYPGTELHETALAQGELSPDADLLQPVYYREEWVRRELIPHVERRFSGSRNCVMYGVSPREEIQREINKVYPVFRESAGEKSLARPREAAAE